MGKLQRIGIIIGSIALIFVTLFRLLEYSSVPLIVDFAAYLRSLTWFSVTAVILLLIVLVGAIVLLIYAIKSPSATTHIVVKKDGGNVDVSTTAIKSVIRHVIARHTLIKLESIRIHVRRPSNPSLQIKVRINPGRQIQLDELGLALQEEIADTVEKFCGGIVESVTVVFTSAGNTSMTSKIAPFGSSSSKFHPNEPQKPASVATITVEDVASDTPAAKDSKPALPEPKSEEGSPKEDTSSVALDADSVDPADPADPPAKSADPEEESSSSDGSSVSGKLSRFFKRTFGSDASSDSE